MPRDEGTPGTDRTRWRHRLHVSGITPGVQVVSGDEAHHAVRVKRLRPGELVELFDGRGTVLAGAVADVGGSRQHPEITIEPAGEPEFVASHTPRVEIWTPAPKGDRLERMLDQLSQAGVAGWRLLGAERAEDNMPKKPDRLRRVIIESAKQSGRAHLLEIGDPIALDAALETAGVVVASQHAGPGPRFGPGEPRTLLVGPEGGWSGSELRLFEARAVPCLGLGPHVMRLETAALVGAARLMEA
ncbi:MAG: RsmE family RNA methyltransferase [Phycisphaerales bacterium]